MSAPESPPQNPPVPFVHEKKYDERCEICTSDRRVAFEKLYKQREGMAVLRNMFGWADARMHQHGRACNLYGPRMDNTNAIRREIMERGLEALQEGKMEITVKDLLRAGFDTDKIKGRIVDKVQINHPKILFLGAIPLPGGGKITKSEAQLAPPPESTLLKLKKPERDTVVVGKAVEIDEETTQNE